MSKYVCEKCGKVRSEIRKGLCRPCRRTPEGKVAPNKIAQERQRQRDEYGYTRSDLVEQARFERSLTLCDDMTVYDDAATPLNGAHRHLKDIAPVTDAEAPDDEYRYANGYQEREPSPDYELHRGLDDYDDVYLAGVVIKVDSGDGVLFRGWDAKWHFDTRHGPYMKMAGGIVRAGDVIAAAHGICVSPTLNNYYGKPKPLFSGPTVFSTVHDGRYTVGGVQFKNGDFKDCRSANLVMKDSK